MKYHPLTDRPIYHTSDEDTASARMYWGPGPFPKHAELMGIYTDDHRAGALFRFKNGNHVVGYHGVISNVSPLPDV